MEMYNGTKENMGRKYDMFAHFVIKDDDGKDITIYIGEEFVDRGVCYLIANIESRSEHSMITITVNTGKLEDRGLLDEQ